MTISVSVDRTSARARTWRRVPTSAAPADRTGGGLVGHDAWRGAR